MTREELAMAAIAGRKRRVEGVDAVRDAALDGGQVGNAEEVPRPIRGELRGLRGLGA